MKPLDIPDYAALDYVLPRVPLEPLGGIGNTVHIDNVHSEYTVQ